MIQQNMEPTDSSHIPASGQRKGKDVYSWLKKQIMLSDYRPGQPLVELEIAAAMGCSQGTVREALLRLQEEGLIVRQGYRGTIVSPISSVEAPVFLGMRADLEAQAARQSVPRIRPEHLATLADLVRRMEEAAAAGDEYRLFELDQQFHVTLFQLAEMPSLVPVLVRCSLYNHRNKIALDVAPRTLMETARRHWAIVNALQGGDAAEVERVLRHHVQSVVGDEARPAQEAPAPRLDPALEAILRRVQQEDAALPDITTLPLDQARAQFERVNERWNRIDREAFDITEFEIPAMPRPGRAAGQGLRAVRVAHRARHQAGAGTLLHLHGGGWVFGSNRTHLGAMARLAEATGCSVVGIDYGLAPDAPFPHGLADCTWAWRWLRAQAAAGGDAQAGAPWYVAGDSAGANLALALMLDLRRDCEPLPDAALLFYGVYDADHGTDSHRRNGDGRFGLSTAKMAWYRGHYLSGAHQDPQDPRVSPLRARLSGLPPLLVTGAELDPLYDDSVRLAQRLSETDTPFEFRRYAGMNHGFMQLGAELPAARRAFEDAAAFLRAHR